MKGDFTRFSHQPHRQYAGVLMQQGRVTLDADWNEQFDIDDGRWRTQTVDTIGRACAPVDSAGFGLTLTPDGSDLIIGSGRIYIDGILVELPEGTTIDVVSVDGTTLVVRDLVADGQPFVAGQWVLVHSVPAHSDGGAQRPDERTVARIDAVVPEVSEIQLSVDVSAHADQSNVTVRRLTTYRTQPYYPADADEPFGDSFDPQAWAGSTHLIYLDVWRRHVTAIEDPTLREVALGGPDTATRVQTVWALRILRDAKGGPVDASGIGCADPHPVWHALTAPSTARMSARAQAAPDPDDPCAIQTEAGYRGLENRLYRVEIHEPGPLGTATLTWSRDNGSILSTIVAFEGTDKIHVHSLGKDKVLRFRADDRVEVLSDESELSGQPGTMASVVGPPDEAERIISLDTDVSVHADHTTPRVRRWDHGSTELTTDSDWIDLEDGVEVRFDSGPFDTGDYWVIPARVATGDIEGFVAAPRRGIEHHFARIALVTWSGKTPGEIVDCRSTFSPLCGLEPGGDSCCTVSVGADGDVATLQQAVDAVADVVGPVRICVLPGQHILSAPVVIRRGGITISGCGQQSRVIGTEGNALLLRDGADMRIEHLWLFSSGPRATVAAADVSRFDVVDCLIANATDGRDLARAGRVADLTTFDTAGPALAVTRGNGVRVHRCTLVGTPGASLSGSALRVDHNLLAGGGVWIREGSTRTDIASNIIIGGRGVGILLGGLADGEQPSALIDGVTATVIIDNRIEGMSQEGISTPPEEERSVGEIDDLFVARNDIRRCGGAPFGDTVAVGGGIYLRDGTGIRLHDNHLENNGPQEVNAQLAMGFGISVLSCQNVDIRRNTILHNGPTSTGQDERVVLNVGISAMAVLGAGGGGGLLPEPLQVGAPAVTIHNNVVVTPNGPAVLVYGAGPMSINDNILTSQLEGPSPLNIGRTVLVGNVGVSPDLAMMLALTGGRTQSRVLHGAVQLNDNQITTQAVASGLPPAGAGFDADRARPAELMLGSVVLAFTYDALSIEGNQVLNEAYPPVDSLRTIRASVWALGGTLHATGNRVTEVLLTALLSYYGIGLAHLAAHNITTHCIRVDAPPAARVERDNIELFCIKSGTISPARHHKIVGM